MQENNNLSNQQPTPTPQPQVVPPQPQVPVQQPTIQMQNDNKKDNKKIFIVVLIIVIAVLLVLLLGRNKDEIQNNLPSDNTQDNENTQNSNQVETDNNENSTSQENAFLMSVEDVFTITGRGTVVTGTIERGEVTLSDEVEIVGLSETKKSVVVGIEMYRKQLDYAQKGDSVGLLLRNVEREQVQRGDVIAKVGSIKAHKTFEAEMHLLTKEEGGRHTPIFSQYRPQFYFRTTDVTGVLTFINGEEMLMPGGDITAKVELVSSIAMEKGTEFTIREGGKTIGTGKITKIIE